MRSPTRSPTMWTPSTGPSFSATSVTGAGGLQDLRPAVAGEVVGGGDDVVAALLGDGRREPDRGDLGVGVGDPRDAVVVDRDDGQPGQPLGDQDALAEADVGQLQARAQMSPIALMVGMLVWQVASTLTKPRSSLDAGLLVAESGRHRPAADGDEQQLGRHRLAVLQGDGDAVVRDLSTSVSLVPTWNAMPLRRNARSSSLDDDSSSAGTRCGSASTIVTVGAEGVPDRGELAADRAGAEHDDRRRHLVEGQRVVAGDDPLAVDR